MMRFVRYLILIALVGAVVAYGYVWWRVNSSLGEVASSIAPVGSLNYDSAYPDLNGNITINDVSLYPPVGLNYPPLLVDQVVISTPGLPFLLTFNADLRRSGTLPSQLGLTMRNVEVNVDAGSGGMWVSGHPFESLACGEVEAFQGPELVALGYPTLRHNTEFSYELLDSRTVVIRFMLETVQVATTQVELELAADSPLDGLTRGVTPKISLGSADFRWQDEAFNNRRNEFCAEELGVAVDEYKERNVEQFLGWLAEREVTPSLRAIEQYRATLDDSASVSIQMEPESKLYVDRLPVYGYEELSRLLNPLVAVGEETPEPVLLKFGPASVVQEEGDSGSEASEPAADSDQVVADATSDQTDEPKVQRQPEFAVVPDRNKQRKRYRETPFGALSAYVGKRVIVYAASGETWYGVIEGATANRLKLYVETTGGTATVPLAKSQVRRVTVFR